MCYGWSVESQSGKNKKCHKTGHRGRFLSSDRSCGPGSIPRNMFQTSNWVKSDIFDTFFNQNLADMHLFLYLCSRYAGLDNLLGHSQTHYTVTKVSKVYKVLASHRRSWAQKTNFTIFSYFFARLGPAKKEKKPIN